MYTKIIPHKNFKGRVRNQEVCFNLTVHEVLKLLVQFKIIFEWQERIQSRDPDAETPTEEVIEFYNNFEDILLAAWGELDETGDYFRKVGVYDFRESSLFHASMELFLKDQAEINKLLDGIMPEGLKELVQSADDKLAELAKSNDNAAINAEVARLRKELDAAKAGETPAS